ncbi:MAG: cation transporter [Blastocatellia bacterium]|nr:cation transporter [Blastocatellia bacterium]
MRRIISVFSAAALTLALLVTVALAGVTEKKLRVDGMTCGGCSASVEHALKKVDGVMEAKANHGSEGTVWVKYDDEKVELSKIKQVIADAGFEVVDK